MSDNKRVLPERTCGNCDLASCGMAGQVKVCGGWRRRYGMAEAPRPQDSSGSAGFTGCIAGLCKECHQKMDEKHPMHEAIEKGLCGKCCDHVAQVQNDLCP